MTRRLARTLIAGNADTITLWAFMFGAARDLFEHLGHYTYNGAVETTRHKRPCRFDAYSTSLNPNFVV
jgi:hypothetical protein